MLFTLATLLLSLTAVKAACDTFQITNPAPSPQALVYRSGRPLTVSWDIGSSTVNQITGVNLAWAYAESDTSSMAISKIITSPLQASQRSVALTLPTNALLQASYYYELYVSTAEGQTCYFKTPSFYIRD
ncbi:hypothetical protein K493DRAFT_344592 [Basidiobolus meristosporus CBS 931.73]|uniref:Fibronectin type-III domain-containing protein n=1 Tax=Basidiobolus meristosporus CBS 931.73 TaxID=1314790 RepID=A0A1Y1Z8C0_9FUNG|nr:hypothetical protein K493DRAFT_344592 [Basidiobolus meristosporus CBS 931.73]|eukprot:ORY06354.1 hypothetical protein K493DRAFT_344592 [Basidiobolus meristosporus CBS 931.73]